jgi:hypothetical protein
MVKLKATEISKRKDKPQVRKMEKLLFPHYIKLLPFSQDSTEDFA